MIRANYNDNNNNNVVKKPVNVKKFTFTIKNKNCVIFCRVSSFGQTGPTHISFEVQERKGMTCASMFKLRVGTVIKVVESAYKGNKCTIKSLISKFKGKNIIMYNVTRFCRNENLGIELLQYALDCNTRLFFVEEGIIWDRDNQDNLGALRRKLIFAEEESAAIGRRVKDALAEKKRRGFFTGGIPKYGFKVVDAVEGGDVIGRKSVPYKYEQAVIKFINMCKEPGTSVRTLNEWMRQLSPDFNAPIEFWYEDRKTNTLRDVLSYTDIANLLNEYGVTKRGNKWSGSMISSICIRGYDNILEGMANLKF